MERNIDMKEVSDGRFYTGNDLIKADCGGCQGCSACCRGMGSSITLDPFDMFCLCRGLKTDFDRLLEDRIELNIADHLILPNIRMTEGEEACVFLNREGRCSIHAFRPGMCRLFPLGRFYEGDSFKYFLQVHECPKKNKTKVKIKRWLGVADPGRYEQFIGVWHAYLKGLREQVKKDPQQIKEISMGILRRFYMTPYDWEQDFHEQFRQRMERKGSGMTV